MADQGKDKLAFGKDEAAVSGMRMNNRQAMRQSAKRAPRGGGGGGFTFRDKWQPPVDGSTDVVRLLAGQYLLPMVDHEAKDFYRDGDGNIIQQPTTFYKYQEYYFNPSKRYLIGSEGPLGEYKGKGDPCLAADWFWYEWRERGKTTPPAKTPNTLRRTEKFALSVLVQAPFFNAPQTDHNGAVRMNDKTSTPYLEWQKGDPRGNDALAAGGYEKKNGHVMHWSLNFMHWQTLLDYQDSLACNCRSCGGQETIHQVALVCQHCGDAVVEFESTSLSEAELNKFRNDKVTCGHCKMTGYLDDVIECNNCPKAEQSTLFDYDITLKRVKDANATNENQTNLLILKSVGPRPLDAKFGANERKPIDLPKLFAPWSMEKQRELLGDVPDAPVANEEQQQQEAPLRQPATGGSRGYSR